MKKFIKHISIFAFVVSLMIPHLRPAPAHASTWPTRFSLPTETLPNSVLKNMFDKINADMPNWHETYYYAVRKPHGYTGALNAIELWPKTNKFFGKLNSVQSAVTDWMVTDTNSGTVPVYLYGSTGAFQSIQNYPYTGPRTGILRRATASNVILYSNFGNIDFQTYDGITLLSDVPLSQYGEKELPASITGIVPRGASFIFPGDLDSDTLARIFEPTFTALPGWRDTHYYYLTKVQTTSTTFMYNLLFIPKSGSELVASDMDFNDVFETLTLNVNASTSTPALLFRFDGASGVQIPPENSDTITKYVSYNVHQASVYYTSVPVRLQSIPPEDDSPSLRQRINSRELPASFINYLDAFDSPDARLGYFGAVGSDGFWINIMTQIQAEKMDWYAYDFTVRRTSDKSRMAIQLFPRGSVKFVGVLNVAGVVDEWRRVYTRGLNLTQKYYTYFFDLDDKNFNYVLVEAYEATEDDATVFSTPFDYSNITACELLSVDGVVTPADCFQYGLKDFHAYIYNSMTEIETSLQVRILYAISRMLEFIFGIGGIIGNAILATIDFLLTPFKPLIDAYVALMLELSTKYYIFFEGIGLMMTTLSQLLDSIPEQIRSLVLTAFSISISLFVYKLYRMIRGIFI